MRICGIEHVDGGQHKLFIGMPVQQDDQLVWIVPLRRFKTHMACDQVLRQMERHFTELSVGAYVDEYSGGGEGLLAGRMVMEWAESEFITNSIRR